MKKDSFLNRLNDVESKLIPAPPIEIIFLADGEEPPPLTPEQLKHPGQITRIILQALPPHPKAKTVITRGKARE